MSYNVKNGSGMDGRRDDDRTARVIADAKPEAAALQELAARITLTETYAKATDYSGGS